MRRPLGPLDELIDLLVDVLVRELEADAVARGRGAALLKQPRTSREVESVEIRQFAGSAVPIVRNSIAPESQALAERLLGSGR